MNKYDYTAAKMQSFFFIKNEKVFNLYLISDILLLRRKYEFTY